MNEWDPYKIDFPPPGGWTGQAAELDQIHHIVHPQAARFIMDEGRIRPGIVYDHSRLNTTRTTVIWLSAKLWPGSIYGTVQFSFPWVKLIEGCRFYWVEDVLYQPPAYRILVTTRDYSHLSFLTLYDPSTEEGPLRVRNGVWYYNQEATGEFMFDRDLELWECQRVKAIKHKEDGCRIYRNGCRDLRTSESITAMRIVATIISNGIHSVDHTYTRHMVVGSPSQTSSEFQSGISTIWLKLVKSSHCRFGGPVSAIDQSKAVVKGALALLAIGHETEARELVSVLDSDVTCISALEALIDDHFGFAGWKIGS